MGHGGRVGRGKEKKGEAGRSVKVFQRFSEQGWGKSGCPWARSENSQTPRRRGKMTEEQATNFLNSLTTPISSTTIFRNFHLSFRLETSELIFGFFQLFNIYKSMSRDCLLILQPKTKALHCSWSRAAIPRFVRSSGSSAPNPSGFVTDWSVRRLCSPERQPIIHSMFDHELPLIHTWHPRIDTFSPALVFARGSIIANSMEGI